MSFVLAKMLEYCADVQANSKENLSFTYISGIAFSFIHLTQQLRHC